MPNTVTVLRERRRPSPYGRRSPEPREGLCAGRERSSIWRAPAPVLAPALALAVPLALLALAASAPGALAKPNIVTLTPRTITVHARRLAHFDAAHPGRRRFGRLIWRGGLVLTSPSAYFGGFSGLALGPQGRALVSVSDAGLWMTGRIGYRDGRPTGLAHVRIGPIRARGGRPLATTRERDAEAVEIVSGSPGAGRLLIAFERVHRIGRFDWKGAGVTGPSSYLRLPKALGRAKPNKSLEAITILRGGPLEGLVVAFAERLLDRRGNLIGWLFTKRGPRRITLARLGGFDITGLASLPDGGLLVLERRFRWSEGVKARIRRLRLRDIRPGALLTGEVLFEADSAYQIDNMEGIAVHRTSEGETVVTLLSDDNYAFFQRTLLLQFTLSGKRQAFTPAGERQAGAGRRKRR